MEQVGFLLTLMLHHIQIMRIFLIGESMHMEQGGARGLRLPGLISSQVQIVQFIQERVGIILHMPHLVFLEEMY